MTRIYWVAFTDFVLLPLVALALIPAVIEVVILDVVAFEGIRVTGDPDTAVVVVTVLAIVIDFLVACLVNEAVPF